VSGDSLLAEHTSAILRTVPAMMLAARKLAQALAHTGTPVEPSRLLTVLKSFPERFILLPSKDDVVIALNKNWEHAQR
jgi:hypothetical protein